MKAIDREFLLRALAYAKERWCWDDTTFIHEYYESHGDSGGTPEDFVDCLAIRYGLSDPKGLF